MKFELFPFIHYWTDSGCVSLVRHLVQEHYAEFRKVLGSHVFGPLREKDFDADRHSKEDIGKCIRHRSFSYYEMDIRIFGTDKIEVDVYGMKSFLDGGRGLCEGVLELKVDPAMIHEIIEARKYRLMNSYLKDERERRRKERWDKFVRQQVAQTWGVESTLA